jgi:hypothetical protein
MGLLSVLNADAALCSHPVARHDEVIRFCDAGLLVDPTLTGVLLRSCAGVFYCVSVRARARVWCLPQPAAAHQPGQI